MSEILLYYKRPDPTTWVYLSSFLTIGLYFVFHRFWSVRNLDIVLLILLAPGLLMVHEGRRRQYRELESEVIAARQHKPATENPPSESPPSTRRRATSGHQTLMHSGGTTLVSQVEIASDDVNEDGNEPSDDPSVSDETADSAATVSADTPEAETTQPETPPETQSDPADLRELDAAGLAEIDIDYQAADTSEYYSAQSLQRHGFITLFFVQAFILIRLLMDPLMVRRPLLDPNLTTGGLYFISISLFIFMMGNVVTSTPRMQVEQGPKLGPGYALMHKLPAITTRPVSDALAAEEPPSAAELDPSNQHWTMVARVLAILAHLAIVSGIVLIGNRHFGNLRAGVGAATLYLMLPYTAQMTGRADHALPAALLLWAILMYRKPMFSGVFLGLAAGLVYYPLFLLPLWCSFYWRRGVRRFAVSVVATLTVLSLLLSLGGTESLFNHLVLMFGLRAPTMQAELMRGIWGLGWNPVWRLPVIVGFGILSCFFAAWPSPKNLGTLISCSAAVMVAAQFWHGYGGGLYIAWFLPLLLLTIFRPNLQDRVALKVVVAGNGAARQTESRRDLEAEPA